jgi:hypothetical protein
VRYMLLIYSSPATWNAMSPGEREQFTTQHAALHEQLLESGEWVGGNALADPSQSQAVRVRDDLRIVTEGPYAETREHLAGYIVVDVVGLDRVLDIATQIPDAHLCGVEVRPVLSQSGMEM